MEFHHILLQPEGRNLFFVGIKGTGTSGLAEILLRRGASVSGSDGDELFYTDAILGRVGIEVTSFSPKEITHTIDMVIYSAAYSPETQPQLVEAGKLGIPCVSYFEALGIVASKSKVCAICGTHGKTSTTAILGTLAKEFKLSATTLTGGGVSSFDGHSVHMEGEEFFIVESCEYRKHFLNFFPHITVVTSLEGDHFDSYLGGIEDVKESFVAFLLQIKPQGSCIYFADDTNVTEVVDRVKKLRPDITYTPYGATAKGELRIECSQLLSGKTVITLQGVSDPLEIRFPGDHTSYNVAASVGALAKMVDQKGSSVKNLPVDRIQRGLLDFRGVSRRSELVGVARGVTILDDYGHHPTEMLTTLRGFRSFYGNPRIVLSFMSHTYTRTAALFDEFASVLQEPDVLYLHRIYGSAREQLSDLSVSGESLYQETLQRGRSELNTRYVDEPLDAVELILGELQEGDLFITMGAGDNWTLGRAVLKGLEEL